MGPLMAFLACFGRLGCSVPSGWSGGCSTPGMQGSLIFSSLGPSGRAVNFTRRPLASCVSSVARWARSWSRFQYEVEVGGAAVGDVRLAPRLDGERDADEGVEHSHEVARIVGQ